MATTSDVHTLPPPDVLALPVGAGEAVRHASERTSQVRDGSGRPRLSLKLARPVPLLAWASVAGPMEGRGPLGRAFDRVAADHLLGRRTWEMAEAALQEAAIEAALAKAALAVNDVDLVVGGDLLNQLGAASFAARSVDRPFFGLYAACATLGQGLLLAAALCDAGLLRRALVVVSSHHDAAERQFRFPTEFGNQRPPTAQWTATGAAAFVVGRPRQGAEGAHGGPRYGQGTYGTPGGAAGDGRRPADPDGRPPDGGRPDADSDGARRAVGPTGGTDRLPRIVGGTPGRVVDMGLKNPFDMGGAEAAAAADTISVHLHAGGRDPREYDAVATGDLGLVGAPVCEDILASRGIGVRLRDCALELYDRRRQDVHAGGSGAGCCGLVLAADILPRLQAGEWRRALFVATGALLSPTSYQQGESVPCVAHAVEITAGGEGASTPS